LIGGPLVARPSPYRSYSWARAMRYCHSSARHLQMFAPLLQAPWPAAIKVSNRQRAAQLGALTHFHAHHLARVAGRGPERNGARPAGSGRRRRQIRSGGRANERASLHPRLHTRRHAWPDRAAGQPAASGLPKELPADAPRRIVIRKSALVLNLVRSAERPRRAQYTATIALIRSDAPSRAQGPPTGRDTLASEQLTSAQMQSGPAANQSD
jgi:hypothetical protein